jgi:hypothetical protein
MRALAASYRRDSFCVFHTPTLPYNARRPQGAALTYLYHNAFLSCLVRDCPDFISGARGIVAVKPWPNFRRAAGCRQLELPEIVTAGKFLILTGIIAHRELKVDFRVRRQEASPDRRDDHRRRPMGRVDPQPPHGPLAHLV